MDPTTLPVAVETDASRKQREVDVVRSALIKMLAGGKSLDSEADADQFLVMALGVRLSKDEALGMLSDLKIDASRVTERIDAFWGEREHLSDGGRRNIQEKVRETFRMFTEGPMASAMDNAPRVLEGFCEGFIYGGGMYPEVILSELRSMNTPLSIETAFYVDNAIKALFGPDPSDTGTQAPS